MIDHRHLTDDPRVQLEFGRLRREARTCLRAAFALTFSVVGAACLSAARIMRPDVGDEPADWTVN